MPCVLKKKNNAENLLYNVQYRLYNKNPKLLTLVMLWDKEELSPSSPPLNSANLISCNKLSVIPSKIWDYAFFIVFIISIVFIHFVNFRDNRKFIYFLS